MNLQELWSGYDYSWWPDKGRGEQYREWGERVKVIRCFKKRLYGNTKDTGFAEVMRLEDDGTPKLDREGNHKTTEVRARDIAMRWEEYAEVRAHRQADEARRAKERSEKEEAKRQAELAFKQKMVEKYGIPLEAISLQYGSVYLSRPVIEKDLGIINE